MSFSQERNQMISMKPAAIMLVGFLLFCRIMGMAFDDFRWTAHGYPLYVKGYAVTLAMSTPYLMYEFFRTFLRIFFGPPLPKPVAPTSLPDPYRAQFVEEVSFVEPQKISSPRPNERRPRRTKWSRIFRSYPGAIKSRTAPLLPQTVLLVFGSVEQLRACKPPPVSAMGIYVVYCKKLIGPLQEPK